MSISHTNLEDKGEGESVWIEVSDPPPIWWRKPLCRDIMNFARVFTGFDEQAERANIEHVEGKSNMIDPMQMKAEWHDAYPKPKLDGA